MLYEKLQFKCISGDLGTVSGRLVVGVCSAQRHSYRLRRSRFDSRAGHRQQLATAATFLQNYVAYVLSRGNGPRVRYTLRRNTARVMKIWCFSSVLVKLFQMLNFFLRCYCYCFFSEFATRCPKVCLYCRERPFCVLFWVVLSIIGSLNTVKINLHLLLEKIAVNIVG